MNCRWTHLFLLIINLCFFTASAAAQDNVNVATNSAGRLPRGEDGRTLNFDFETGDLRDWIAEGDAWEGQPDKDGIDPNRPFAEGKKSLHTGKYWIGGFEIVGDKPKGTLTSVPFVVDAPWCSFLVGGGNGRKTSVEIVLADSNARIVRETGSNAEELRPVVLNLEKYKGKKIFIRLVDESSSGWGHVNFDDFRFHDVKPVFKMVGRSVSPVLNAEIYPYENLTGEEAARVMQVPPGFKVQCSATEPDVMQPIAMAIDDRGRVWVAEAYEYPIRAPEGKGRDRILIFEDTDQDGILDRRTVFLEGLNLVSGIEIGFGGVYIGAAPYLLFVPDRNGNDIPDGLEPGAVNPPVDPNVRFPKDIPPGAEVLLDGWGWEDTHETLNAFIWGPDGWLYGCHGVFTHSKVGKPGTPDDQRIPINAGIWRYHPVRHEFQVFIEGTSNPWGVDFNATGDAFCTACVIPHLYYLIPNGRYIRQAGKHFNPHSYIDLQTIARHRHYTGNQWNQADRRSSDQLGGGHAHAGAMVYQGGAWPEEYNGKLFMHNIHGNRVNVDQLIPEGSGYAGDRYPDFLLTGDKWSQMINLQYGPDGQVWMIDWYDQEQCHRVNAEVVDRGNGRIYRVYYGDAKPVAVDLGKESNAALIRHALTAHNEWYARHARRLLQERAAIGEASLADIQEANVPIQESDPIQVLRLMWLRNLFGGFSGENLSDVERFLQHDSPHVRSWAIRLIVQNAVDAPVPGRLLQRFAEMAAQDPSPIVRLGLASAACWLPVEVRWPILENLVTHKEDAKDHNIPAMLWYAMEPCAGVDPQRALALGMSAGEAFPELRELMIRRLGSGKPENALALLVTGLSQAKDDAVRLTFLKGIRGAIAGLREVTLPKEWDVVYKTLVVSDQQSRDFNVYLYALGLGARFGDPVATDRLAQIILDEAGAQAERRVGLAFLLEDRNPRLFEILPQLLNGTSLRAEALKAVAAQDRPELALAIIANYKALSPAEQADARNTLASRVSYAVPLLQAIETNRIPKGDLSADVVRQLQNLNHPDVNSLLEKVWGVVRQSNEDVQARIASLTKMIRDPNGPPVSLELGRAVFVKTCQQCHTLFGTGAKIGPDITGSNRANLEYILSNIVDPSSVMAKEYRPTIVVTDDGRVITGILKDENDKTITLQTTNELITLPKDEIDDRKESDKSMMPDGLLNQLSPREIRSLIAYLAAPGQVPILATPETIGRFFNGTDLTGWRASRESDQQYWSVENGEIVGRTQGIRHNSFLMNELLLGDFRLVCEVLLVDNKGNSGIQLRSQPLPNGEMRGYQADIGKGWWGKLYEEEGRGLLVDNDAEKHIKPGEWNRYEIIAVGSRVQTFLNGQPAVDINDPQGAREGLIALQLHSGGATEVRFRNFQLELLSPLPSQSQMGTPAGYWPSSRPMNGESKISWKKTMLDGVFRSEGCCIADFDNDGDLDIASGSVWYENPGPGSDGIWKQRLFLSEPAEFNPKTYGNTFMNYADDLNGDGWLDLIVVGFPGQETFWYENPGTGTPRSDQPWKQHLVIPETNNESPQYLDIDGDGKRELLSGVDRKIMALSRPATFPHAPWKIHAISEPDSPGTEKFSHGLGAGDINGDGRPDVVVTSGWWEQPASDSQGTWTFHEAPFGPACSQMYVFDFDGDGDADVISASAHRTGVWWYEQITPPEGSNEGVKWKQHKIDDSVSQTHAAVLADINGDGLPDFVTGRRYLAHNGRDPGEDQPPVLVWYELQRTPEGPVWKRHLIDEDSGVGTQFEVGDVNNDGLLDIVISNKRGTFLLEQVRE